MDDDIATEKNLLNQLRTDLRFLDELTKNLQRVRRRGPKDNRSPHIVFTVIRPSFSTSRVPKPGFSI